MLELDRQTGEMQDKHFYDIIDQLNPGDAVVMNNSRVMPARLYGVKPETGGHAEVLLLHNTEGDEWETLMKPAKRAKVGTVISFGDGKLTATVTAEKEDGIRMIEFHYDGIFMEILESLGETPLPPYIKENSMIQTVIKLFMPRKMARQLRQQLVYTGRRNSYKKFKTRVLSWFT